MMIVCSDCKLFFKPKRNGVYIEEGMPVQGGEWAPYKIWAADLYECCGCGKQIITGFGHGPIAEHFQPGYKQILERLTPLRVNDCA